MTTMNNEDPADTSVHEQRELPELEALLTRGGRGEGGFESWRLLGAEVLPANAKLNGKAGLPDLSGRTTG